MQSLTLMTLALVLASSAAHAQEPGRLDSRRMFPSGKVAFEKLCARCHTGREDAVGPNLKTGDHDSDIIHFFARHGSGPMPAFTEAMIDNASLDEVAAYVAEQAAKGKTQ